MQVLEIIHSSIVGARSHFRRVVHLEQMALAPNPVIRIAAHAMRDALRNNPGDNVFIELEHKVRVAGHVRVADAIEDLTKVLTDEIEVRSKSSITKQGNARSS